MCPTQRWVDNIEDEVKEEKWNGEIQNRGTEKKWTIEDEKINSEGLFGKLTDRDSHLREKKEDADLRNHTKANLEDSALSSGRRILVDGEDGFAQAFREVTSSSSSPSSSSSSPSSSSGWFSPGLQGSDQRARGTSTTFQSRFILFAIKLHVIVLYQLVFKKI